MKIKIFSKTVKYCFFLLFTSFIALYVSQASGYFEYQNNKRSALTQKQIQKFESDVKNGKNVDINNYIVKEKNYDNNLGKAGLSVSQNSEKLIQKLIAGFFKVFSKLLG